jgi:hypothetical protein
MGRFSKPANSLRRLEPSKSAHIGGPAAMHEHSSPAHRGAFLVKKKLKSLALWYASGEAGEGHGLRQL